MDKLHMDHSPFIRHSDTTKTLMTDTVMMLCVLLAYSAYLYGARAIIIAALTVISCGIFEIISTKVFKKAGTVRDLSAVVTALVLTGCCSPGVPLWFCPVASALAIFVFKALFGGLGKNRFNPAAASMLVLSLVFRITASSVPAENISPFAVRADFTPYKGALDAVNAGNIPDASIIDLLLGREKSALFFAPVILIILCGAYLFIRHTADLRTCAAYLVSGFAAAFIASNLNGEYALYYLLTGATAFAAVFMMTDPVTSPATNTGRIVYGAAAGVLTFILRRYTLFWGAPFAAICAANLISPVIEYVFSPVPFGKGARGISGTVKRHRDYVNDFKLLIRSNKTEIDRRRQSAPHEGLTAQVMCGGRREFCSERFIYDGSPDCASSVVVGGGRMSCPYCCEGYGDCVKACPKGAIKIIDGAAAVDMLLCDGCGDCLESCPKQLITLLPKSAKYWIGCVSGEDQSSTERHCRAGCNGCGECERACPENAVTVTDNRAKIDYAKCTGCGKCFEVCPRKCVWQAR